MVEKLEKAGLRSSIALTDPQIASMIRNYRKAGRETGGIYSLSELLLEQRRRTPSIFPTRELAQKIVAMSRQSPDGLVTYGELWSSCLPDRPWEGNNSRRIMANALSRVIAYCVDNNLPVMTVLVVRQSPRALSDDAIRNIYDESRQLGIDVGHEPRAFVERQRQSAIELSDKDLPLDRE